MPDVQVRYPSHLFEQGRLLGSEVQKSSFMTFLQSLVAHQLSCLNYEGEAYMLADAEINVHLIPYEKEDVSFNGPTMFVQIMAYKFPDRMENIEERLTNIKTLITKLLEDLDYVPKDEPVEVTFIPIENGCWV